eukprot:6515265-Ditylum_brightwellii.AAC.1
MGHDGREVLAIYCLMDKVACCIPAPFEAIFLCELVDKSGVSCLQDMVALRKVCRIIKHNE